jgi:hypothetical protein
VRTTDSKQPVDGWSLQSGFDGDELLARPGIEIITVETIRKAELGIESCEQCHPHGAENSV